MNPGRAASEIERDDDRRVVVDAIGLVRRRAWIARGSWRLAMAAAAAAAVLALGAIASRVLAGAGPFGGSAAWGVAIGGAATVLVVGIVFAVLARIGSSEAAQVLDRLVGGRQECVAAEEMLRRGETGFFVTQVVRAAAARIAAEPSGRFAVRHPVEAWGVTILLGIATFAILGLPARESGVEDRFVTERMTSSIDAGGDDGAADATRPRRGDSTTTNASPRNPDAASAAAADPSRDPDARSSEPTRDDRDRLPADDARSGPDPDEAMRRWMRSLGGDRASSEELARLRRVRDAASKTGAPATSGSATPADAVPGDFERASGDSVDLGYPARYREVVARYFDPAR